MESKISVIGLGYVGLPLTLAIANKFENVVGFDISADRVARLNDGEDVTNEGLEGRIESSKATFTAEPADLENTSFFIVSVPTPIDIDNRPDLRAIKKACDIVGSQLSKNSVVVFESTVYPGVTEEVCGPELEKVSGLKCGVDFFLGYSPERVNPGDKKHTIENIVKVVAGQNSEILERVADLYGAVITAGVFKAKSIRVAEAAKVIENTQRDLNIALMNELSLIFDRLNINTLDVLEAAETKWNFLSFKPGLVGGHCIGVDPYYLTTKAEQAGYKPQVILAGRRINDNMGKFVANKLVKLLSQRDVSLVSAKVALLGLTFKENVADIRNSRVPEILKELRDYNVTIDVYDPRASATEAKQEYDVDLKTVFPSSSGAYDAIIFAVPHKEFIELPISNYLSGMSNEAGVFIDIKGAYKDSSIPSHIYYWSL